MRLALPSLICIFGSLHLHQVLKASGELVMAGFPRFVWTVLEEAFLACTSIFHSRRAYQSQAMSFLLLPRHNS